VPRTKINTFRKSLRSFISDFLALLLRGQWNDVIKTIMGLYVLNLKYGCTSTVTFILADIENLWHSEFNSKLNKAGSGTFYYTDML
jgi:hypothetical protein